MNLVNVTVFGVNNIFMVIVFFWRSAINNTGQPDQKVLVKANFHYNCHYWYLVVREREFVKKR